MINHLFPFKKTNIILKALVAITVGMIGIQNDFRCDLELQG
jgi:hypothetical protein